MVSPVAHIQQFTLLTSTSAIYASVYNVLLHLHIRAYQVAGHDVKHDSTDSYVCIISNTYVSNVFVYTSLCTAY